MDLSRWLCDKRPKKIKNTIPKTFKMESLLLAILAAFLK